MHTAMIQGKRAMNDEPTSRFEPSHIEHCIDYLRQSLMCISDTTLEVVENITKGVTGVLGFGTQHQCKDFEQLRAWTSERETYGL